MYTLLFGLMDFLKRLVSTSLKFSNLKYAVLEEAKVGILLVDNIALLLICYLNFSAHIPA